MFSMRYRYFRGTDGRRYCFTVEPVFTCPVNMDADDEQVVKIAGELGVRPVWLAGKLRHHANRKRDDNGRLTRECGNCGAKMKRLGFRRWIEGKPAEGSSNAVSARINERLGGDGFVMVEGPWFSPTKKDAREWAYGRSR